MTTCDRDFLADLVSDKIYEPIVKKIISAPLGHWLDVGDLLIDHGRPKLRNKYFSTWMTYSLMFDGAENSTSDEFVLIVFFDPERIKCFTAIYNKENLLKPKNVK